MHPIQDGPGPEPEGHAFLRELLFFLQAHRHRDVGLLWPQAAPPGSGRDTAGEGWSRLAAELAEGLRCPVRVLPGRRAAPDRRVVAAATETLVVQVSGVSVWRLLDGRSEAGGHEAGGHEAGGHEAGRPVVNGLTVRLRAGEALYLPAGYRTVTPEASGTRRTLHLG
ncbi:hypothetical protein ABTZ03_42025 [Kitasatospora sp. NPDC096077]|uniref:hypothetical protein n=1 Tax=Kitasatospora sp. NPDC096077 TaxID=3155544 RepID=UPI0033283AE3